MLASQFQTDTIKHTKLKRFPLNPGVGKEVFSTDKLLIFGGLVASSFLLDEWTDDGLQHSQNNIMDGYTNVLNEFGSKKVLLPFTISAWTAGTIFKNEDLSTTAFNSIKALYIGNYLIKGIKHVSGRSRPFVGDGSMQWDAFDGTSHPYQSFPSGHTFKAFAVFTPFAEQYSKWIYIIPISTGIARMYKNEHWFSDVIVGGGIGYFLGLYFHKRKNQRVIINGHGIIIKF
jgi:membrane-associated phospholipid phosphatase